MPRTTIATRKPSEEMSRLRKLEMDRRAVTLINMSTEDIIYDFVPRMRVAVKNFNEVVIWKQKTTIQSIMGTIYIFKMIEVRLNRRILRSVQRVRERNATC